MNLFKHFLLFAALASVFTAHSFATVKTTGASTDEERRSFISFYSYYVGGWDVESVSDGKTEKSEYLTIADPSGCNVISSPLGASLWGYNPETGYWTGNGFGIDGSRFESRISRPSGKKIVKGTAFTISGTVWKTDGTMVFVVQNFTCMGPDAYQVISTRVTSEGETLPVEKTIARRKK